MITTKPINKKTRTIELIMDNQCICNKVQTHFTQGKRLTKEHENHGNFFSK